MPLDIVCAQTVLRQRLAPNRNTGVLNGLLRPGDKRMPPKQVASLSHQAISASRRQPIDIGDGFRTQCHTIRDKLGSAGIVAASAGFQIQQPTGNICIMDLSPIEFRRLVPLILAIVFVIVFDELDQATAPTPITQ